MRTVKLEDRTFYVGNFVPTTEEIIWLKGLFEGYDFALDPRPLQNKFTISMWDVEHPEAFLKCNIYYPFDLFDLKRIMQAMVEEIDRRWR